MRRVQPVRLRLDSFLGRLAASLLAASAAASVGACTRESTSSSPTAKVAREEHALTGAVPPPPASSSFVLTVDSTAAGRAADAFGGNLKGTVERAGETNRHYKKRVRTSVYEPISINVAADMPPALAGWVQDSWTNPGESAHDGSVGSVDFNGRVVESLEFFDADLTEVKFPAFDSTARGEGQIAIKIAPGRVDRSTGSGNAPPPRRHKSWVVSNFALDIDGVDTSHVMKIDAFTVKLPTDRHAAIDFPNLVVTLPKAYASTWRSWADTFLGGSSPPNDNAEVSGELRLLAPDLRTTIATIRLDHVGIVRVSDTPASSLPDGAIPTVTVELYVEGMQFVASSTED